MWFRFKQSQMELWEMKPIRLFLMIAFCRISIVCCFMTLYDFNFLIFIFLFLLKAWYVTYRHDHTHLYTPVSCYFFIFYFFKLILFSLVFHYSHYYFFLFFGRTYVMQKFLSQGLNLYLSSDAKSLTQ